jgi:hypothetical protein
LTSKGKGREGKLTRSSRTKQLHIPRTQLTMFLLGNETGLQSAMYNQPNQLSYNLQFPPLRANQTTANHAQLPQLNQQSYHNVQPTYVLNPSTNQISSSTQPNAHNHRSETSWCSDDNLNMSEEDSPTKHQWQTVTYEKEQNTKHSPK